MFIFNGLILLKLFIRLTLTSNKGEILANAEDPEMLYIQEIMPAKLALNLKYIDERGAGKDMRIIFRTLGRIFRS